MNSDATGVARYISITCVRVLPLTLGKVPRPHKVRSSRLSPKQREVSLLLAEGKSNQEIARALALTFNTASYHVKQVFARLQVHNREEVENVLLRLAREAAGAPSIGQRY